jgi:3-oxosteroid 1-dehydrogenase
MVQNPALAAAYDLVIVGSGGGSIAAALAARKQGKTAVILEKLYRVGGSTSFSGGVWWVPNNHLLAEQGIVDSTEKAREYFESVITYEGPGVTARRRDAFLHAVPKAIRFLCDLGLKVRRPEEPWPDYYDDLPGGLAEGRSLMAEPFNMKELGPWQDLLAMYQPSYGIPIGADEFPTLFLMKRTLAGKVKAVKFGLMMIRDKLLGRVSVANGAAIQGRLLQIALREEVNIQRNTPVTRFVVENGRVVGVHAVSDGKPVTIMANAGVICNVGGYSRNKALREQATLGLVGNDWTNANPGDTGEVVQAMIDLGAETDCLDTAWWVITSCGTDGTWPEGAVGKDGTILPFMHHLDISLPHVILVDQTGKRFANESGAYMEIGERLLARQRETGKAMPCWAIFDARHRKNYPWGPFPPGKTPQSWLDSGYMKKADTLRELADLCGIDPAGLKTQCERYNGFCQTGIDEDFASGSRAFDNAHGDPSVKPNPNLGAIEQGPFYACAIYPGDVGTARR